MTPEQTKQLVDFISATKNTTPTEKTYGAWHLLMADLDFEQARNATVLALKDPAITFLEPKHILAKVEKLKEDEELKIRQARALEETKEVVGAPMPKCKHNKGIIFCDPCCHESAVKSGLIPNTPFVPKKKLARLLG
jgi:hypothetical protein